MLLKDLERDNPSCKYCYVLAQSKSLLLDLTCAIITFIMSSTLLIVVFVIQLTLYLINSIGAKTINELLWQVYIRLPLGTSQNIQEQGRLRRDVVRLKREMAAISAQDDFARWAKIRRQHDKALAEYDKTGRSIFQCSASMHAKFRVQLLQSPRHDPLSTPKPQRYDGRLRRV